MNKEKQIEEMTKAFCEVAHYDFCKDTACHVCPIKLFAVKVYDKGYRKINENEVVISKEEYNDLKGLEEKFDDYLIKEIKETRKETAEKCRDFVKQWVGSSEEGLGFLFDFEDFIAKHFCFNLGE